MNSLQLRTAFRRLFAQWYLLGLAARCLQFTLIFEAVSHGVGAAWMGAVMAASSVACAVFTIYAGRLYNRFGPSPLNRCAALCCAGAGFLATQHEAPAALAVAWMLTGMTLMLAATAGYRGIGGLFGAADRVSRFSRMCLLSNVSEIAMPVAIGALFSQAPDLMPFIVLAVSLALSFLSSGVSRSDLRAHGLVESTDLLVNIRRLAGSGPLLAGVVAGSGVNALFCILDILVPTAGGGMASRRSRRGRSFRRARSRRWPQARFCPCAPITGRFCLSFATRCFWAASRSRAPHWPTDSRPFCSSCRWRASDSVWSSRYR